MARAASRAGWDVTYLETLGRGWGGVSRSRTIAGVRVVHACNWLPFAAKASKGRFSRTINNVLTRLFSGIRFDAFDFVVTYDPLMSSLLRGLRVPIAYDCVDAYEYQPQFRADADRLLREEFRTASRAMVRIATAENLATSKESLWGLPVHSLLGAHENLPVRETESARDLKRNAVVVSALDAYKFDPEPILEWLSLWSDWTCDIAGPTIFSGSGHIQDLLDHPRVTFHGVVVGADLKELLSGADFGWVSLASTPYSKFSFPLKTWDYMSAGLPVLAANAPALSGIEGVETTFEDNQPSKREGPLFRHSPASLLATTRAHHVDVRWSTLVELMESTVAVESRDDS